MLSDGERAQFTEITEQFAPAEPQRPRDQRAVIRIAAGGSAVTLAVTVALVTAGSLGERASSWLLAIAVAVVGALAAVALVAYLGLMVHVTWRLAREVRRARLRDHR